MIATTHTHQFNTSDNTNNYNNNSTRSDNETDHEKAERAKISTINYYDTAIEKERERKRVDYHNKTHIVLIIILFETRRRAPGAPGDQPPQPELRGNTLSIIYIYIYMYYNVYMYNIYIYIYIATCLTSLVDVRHAALLSCVGFAA